MKINEVDPRNYDSDIDYYDALNRAGRKAYRDPDSYEKPEPYDAEDDIAQQRQRAAAKFRQKRETQWDTKQEGTAPNGQKYNSRYIINAVDKFTADMEAHSFTDYHWGAKKLVDKEYGKDGDRVVLTLYIVDNHKYGMWKPWADQPAQESAEQGVAEATGNPGMPHDFTAVQPGAEVWYKGRFAGWTTGKVYDDPYGKSGKMVAFEPNPSEFPGDEGRILSLPYDEVSLRKSTSIGKLKGPGQGVAEGVEIVDQDSDLDQQVFTLNVDGKTVSFTYWDYENNFQNPDIKDIYQQAREQLGKKLSPEQIKSVARSVFKSFKQGVAEGSNNIEVGDRITWWYNKFHPNYEGIVRRVSGNTIDVYAPGSGSMYRLSKEDIRSHEKKGVAEGQMPKTWHDVDKKLGKQVDKMSQAEKVKKGFAHPDTFKKKQGVAEGLDNTDDILQGLTSAYRTCVKHRDSYTNFGNIQTVYELLRDPLMKGDIAGYEKIHGYVAGKYPDAFDALMDEVSGEQGVAEGTDNIGSMIQQYEDMVELVYDLPPGRKKNIAIDKRDELEAKIEAMPGGKEALRQWAREYNDSFDEGVAEGFKNTYSVGDRVDGPLGTGVIVAVSPHISTDGRVKVKLDDPSRAGEDGKYKDTFVLDTTQLKHIADEKANPYAIGMAQAMKSTGDKPPLKKSTINKAHEIARAIKKGE